MPTSGTMEGITQDQARSLFAAGSFLVLQNLPPGSEFSVDGGPVYQVGSSFEGVKFIPPGFHLFSYAARPAQEGPSSVFGPLRHGLLHFVRPQEVLLRVYDRQEEAVVGTPRRSGSGGSSDPDGSHRRRRPPPPEPVAISSDHLRTLDPSLAAYPLDRFAEWSKSLTQFIHEDVVGLVLGFDGRGDAHVDAAMDDASASDQLVGSSRTVWGKSQGPAEVPPTAQEAPRRIGWPALDPTRSAPPGAIGPLLTRYARDKSFLLHQLAASHFGGDTFKLLGLLQLSFLLFVVVHNASAMDFYRRLLVAFANSAELLNGRPLAPEAQTALGPDSHVRKSTPAGVGLSSELLRVIEAQLRFLRPAFFAQDAPAEEDWWLSAIRTLGKTLASALAVDVTPERLPEASSADPLVGVRTAWDKLRTTARDRFGWDVGSLSAVEGSERHEADAEEEEDEEDRPVIVEL